MIVTIDEYPKYWLRKSMAGWQALYLVTQPGSPPAFKAESSCKPGHYEWDSSSDFTEESDIENQISMYAGHTVRRLYAREEIERWLKL